MNSSLATATVLFTDVVASTTLRTSRGDLPAHTTLSHHENLLRGAIAAHGGREVKTIGDGFMVVFRAARPAVDCAVAIQRALHGARIGESTLGVAVRVGIHTGDVIEVGDDVFGAAVDAATRIMSQAKGGEILISEMVRGVVGSAGEFGLKERRPVRLKGFPSRWRLYEVDWTQPAAEIVRRDLTVVVTDLAGSTAATDRLGDDGAFALIRGHNAIIRALAAEHRCVHSKFIGDGFMLAFERSAEAIACAVAIQRAFAAQPIESGKGPLRVKIGVHRGTLIVEAGELFGLALMVTFRLVDESVGEELIVTESALADAPAWPVRGEKTLRLRGISGHVTAHAVDWATSVSPEITWTGRPGVVAGSDGAP